MRTDTVRLLISCPDTRGIVAAVSNFISLHNGNIVELDQHTDSDAARFFMRVEIETKGFGLSRETFAPAWRPIADRYQMTWNTHWAADVKRMVILASKESHCLHDLLWRVTADELPVHVPMVISNHDVLRPMVEALGIPFHVLPVDESRGGKAAQERELQKLIAGANADFVVLARYMQILSPEFVERWPSRIINIHHSFLPAFAGPRPYHQAFERGVKIIGATSHFVTAELDCGPIIRQQTLEVDHRDSVQDLIRKGRDLERIVLAAAVRAHVEDKIIVCEHKTVVFG
ncbi:MAG: formyltetrahydrofolate deformylase [Planctomycetota bacterium]|nr:formyltetrahydrofolate deformylase [Planctomycetota bacterium]